MPKNNKNSSSVLNCKDCPAFEKSVFRELDDQALEILSKNKTSTAYKRGQTLFMEGNASYGLFCMGEGNVKVSKASESGKEAIVRISSQSGIVGHRSIFANEPYQATGTVLGNAQACFIDKNYLISLSKQSASVASNILTCLALDLGVSENKVASFSQQNVRERVASLLIFLSESYGEEIEEGKLLNIKFTRDELASLIGTATESVIRIISEFKEENILTQKGKNIILLDLDKLVNISKGGF
jgi:CRP/FNR family transcriptional regulator